MNGFFAWGGDPSDEMDAFIDAKAPGNNRDGHHDDLRREAPGNAPVSKKQVPTKAPTLPSWPFPVKSKFIDDEYEVGRIVGKRGSNFIVQIGNTKREVSPTDIKRVI